MVKRKTDAVDRHELIQNTQNSRLYLLKERVVREWISLNSQGSKFSAHFRFDKHFLLQIVQENELKFIFGTT